MQMAHQIKRGATPFSGLLEIWTERTKCKGETVKFPPETCGFNNHQSPFLVSQYLQCQHCNCSKCQPISCKKASKSIWKQSRSLPKNVLCSHQRQLHVEILEISEASPSKSCRLGLTYENQGHPTNEVMLVVERLVQVILDTDGRCSRAQTG